MRISPAFAFFASGAAAQRTCNRDNCFRQVIASALAGGPVRGSADCSSNLIRTVTPCPTTTFITSSITNIDTVTPTITALTTVVKTETTTVTSTTTTVTNVPLNRKRNLDERQAACPVTATGTKIPPYASSCRSPAQYTSACVCNGFSTAVTTLPVQTITSIKYETTVITATGQPTTLSATTTTTTTTTATAIETAVIAGRGYPCIVEEDPYRPGCGDCEFCETDYLNRDVCVLPGGSLRSCQTNADCPLDEMCDLEIGSLCQTLSKCNV